MYRPACVKMAQLYLRSGTKLEQLYTTRPLTELHMFFRHFPTTTSSRSGLSKNRDRKIPCADHRTCIQRHVRDTRDIESVPAMTIANGVSGDCARSANPQSRMCDVSKDKCKNRQSHLCDVGKDMCETFEITIRSFSQVDTNDKWNVRW
jgi:hypothetical protein